MRHAWRVTYDAALHFLGLSEQGLTEATRGSSRRAADATSQEAPHAVRTGRYSTGTLALNLVMGIGWNAGSCVPVGDSASIRWRNDAGPLTGA